MVTESTAERLFGNENPIGETLSIHDRSWFIGDYEVVGIIRNFPSTSTLQPQVIHSTVGGLTWVWERWLGMRNYGGLRTFVRLHPGSDVETLEEKLSESIVRYMGEEMRSLATYHLQPITEARLHSSTDYGIQGGGNWHHLLILIAVGTFVLAIACINFTNLSTARSARRAREVGLRKVVGGHRTQLFLQFLAESMLLTMVSLLLSIVLALLALPRFCELVGLLSAPEIDTSLLPPLVGFWILTSVLAGAPYSLKGEADWL